MSSYKAAQLAVMWCLWKAVVTEFVSVTAPTHDGGLSQYNRSLIKQLFQAEYPVFQKTDIVPFCRTAPQLKSGTQTWNMCLWFSRRSKCKILFNSLFHQSFDYQFFIHSDVKGRAGNVFICYIHRRCLNILTAINNRGWNEMGFLLITVIITGL